MDHPAGALRPGQRDVPTYGAKIILEIFTDIHGHTRAYWTDGTGHPGLVYNENGEVIRLGRFSDVTAHLEDIKKSYSVTTIYLLGVQKRGTEPRGLGAEATSPSPFSPMSLVEIEPALGGEEELRELVDGAPRAWTSRSSSTSSRTSTARATSLPDEYAVRTYDESGNLVVRASTDGRYGSWNDGKLLNYRKFEVWEWLADSITTLIEKFDIDGIRFDSAHAVPIMMKKNNFPFVYEREARRRGHGRGDHHRQRPRGRPLHHHRLLRLGLPRPHRGAAPLLPHAERREEAPRAEEELFPQHRGMLLGPRAVPRPHGPHPLQLVALQDLREHHPREDRRPRDLPYLRQLLPVLAARGDRDAGDPGQPRRAARPEHLRPPGPARRRRASPAS